MSWQTFFCMVAMAICNCDIAFASSSTLTSKCGFASSSELRAAAHEIITKFSKLEPFKLQARLPRENEFVPVRATTDPVIQNDLSQTIELILRNSFLGKLNDAHVMTIVVIRDQGLLGGPATLSDRFMSVYPAAFLESLNALDPEQFQKTLLMVVSHEFGHVVYDAVLRNEPNPTFPQISVNGPLTPLKYHLTVDAIGAELSQTSLGDMSVALLSIEKISA